MFNVSGRWLVKDQIPKFGYDRYEGKSPAIIKQFKRKPFSEFYDEWRAKLQESIARFVKFDKRDFADESYTRKTLQDYCAALAERVPAEHRFELVKAINDAGKLVQDDLNLQPKIEIFAQPEVWNLEPYQKLSFPNTSLKSNSPDVRTIKSIKDLIEAVNKKASVPGGKTELARVLDVAPARISEWLSGKKEPGGEYTLKLLAWVTAKEAK